MQIRLNTNPWTLPGPPTYVEGNPSPEKIRDDKAEADAERREWSPTNAAYELLDRLRGFAGHMVVIQAWDPIMFMLEEEGPNPIRAKCLDVKTMTNSEGLLRAYLLIDDPSSIPTQEGYDDLDSLIPESDKWLFDIGSLYAISVLAE